MAAALAMQFRCKKIKSYQRDLVDVTRQALSNLGLTLREEMAVAYEKRDTDHFENAANRFLELGLDIDKFLGTRREFMLGKWIEDARSWGVNGAEKSYYERDARSILTVWGATLTDYAGRQWNGLMRDYYLPRWRLLIDARLAELKTGTKTDNETLIKQWRDGDLRFARASRGHYSTKPRGDFFVSSRDLFYKYFGEISIAKSKER